MLATTPKITLAAVLSALALLGGSAVASARTSAIHHNPPTAVIVPVRVHKDLPVVGGSTGQGAASESDCEHYGDIVNNLLDQAQLELTTYGNDAYYDRLIDLARTVESGAEDDGCYFINPV